MKSIDSLFGLAILMAVHSFFPHLFFFMALLMAGVLYALVTFAFTSPEAFAKWFSPFFYLSRVFLRSRRDRYDRIFSYISAGIMLVFLVGVQFFLGGFFVTAMFDLWQSPFAIFFVNL